MGIFEKIISVLTPKSYPKTEFGMDDMQFFLNLLRVCPKGSRLNTEQSEPESFVKAFRPWSHRNQPETFEANYYTIDEAFIAMAEKLMENDVLELDHHFSISAPDGRGLCSSLDDFCIVNLADDIKAKIKKQQANP